MPSYSNAFAQINGSLSGTVTHERKESIPGITIVLMGMNQGGIKLGAITDLEDKYEIIDIKPGSYTVEVSGVSYQKPTFQLTFNEGQKLTRSITFQVSTSELDEVVITAKSEAKELEFSAKSVQVIETRKGKLKSADLGEVLAQTEGVNVLRAGGLSSATHFSPNGLSDDQIRFFYDGIPLNFTPYAFGITNVLVNAIDRVEIYKEVVPIQFGADALGGAVILASPEIFDGLNGSASYHVGSFNTHRITGNINYAHERTGLFVAVGGFYDYTINNYKIDVAIPNEQGQLQQRTIRRFHDGYRAYGANVRIGIRDRKWADELSIEGYYGDYDNEVQNSQVPGLIDQQSLGIDQAVVGSPFGEVCFTSFSQGLNLDYNFNLNAQWELDLKAGYSYTERISIDTSRKLYIWFGVVVRVQNQPREFGEADHLTAKSKSFFARQQLIYTLSDHHSFKLSVAPTYQYRTADDLLIEGEFDPALDEGYLLDVVTGPEYTSDFLDKRLQNIAFIKNYRQNIRIESLDPSIEGTFVDERSVSNYGAGNKLKYTWSTRFSTKLSYEFAYRLPRQDEIFGDGQLVQENPELRLESIHNVNLRWNYASRPTGGSEWQLQGNFFLRRIDDLIFLLVDAEEFGSFQNVWSATSQAGLTHRINIKSIQNALTLEVQNLTNAKVFDLFGVQRPGRAFYIKSTIQFELPKAALSITNDENNT
ncbi:MAG: TonB-dependent receptor plug domain-containing protein [Bacteroidota bacterium]